MLNITLAQTYNSRILDKFWLRVTLNDYWFLSAEQWWTIAMQKPWQQANTTTWVAQNTTEKTLIGMVSLCENKIQAFHVEPEIADFFIAKQLLWHAIGTRSTVFMNIFIKETKRREILRNYGFKVTEIDDEPLFFQKMVKMCLHLS